MLPGQGRKATDHVRDEDDNGNLSRNFIRKSSPTKTNLDSISKYCQSKSKTKHETSTAVGYGSRL